MTPREASNTYKIHLFRSLFQQG